MDQSQQIEKIRALAAQARLPEAVTALVALVRSSQVGQPWSNTALQLQARLQRLEQEERLNTISYADAEISRNQITQDVLDLLARIQAGESPPIGPALEEPSSRRLYMWLALGGFVLGLVAIGLYLFNRSTPPPPPDPAVIKETCPTFSGQADFRILILPFQPLDNGPQTNTHLAIRDRLALESERYNIPASVRVADLEGYSLYPSNGNEAESFGRPCRAQLIIWGTTERRNGQTGDIVLTRFKFIDFGQLELSKLQITEDAEVDTITSLSSIASEGVLTEVIESNIRILFAAIAHEIRRDSAVVAILSNSMPDSSTTDTIGKLLLADSYLELQQNERAIATYSSILNTNPDNLTARNNRGVLLLQKGDYQAAAEDLDVVVSINPSDTMARAARALSNVRAGNLFKVMEDMPRPELPNIKGTTPPKSNHPVFETIEKEYNERDAAEKIRKQQAEAKLQRNPRNVTALQEKAMAAYKLGYLSEALQTSQRIIKLDRDNAPAHAVQIQSHLALRDTVTARRVARQAEQRKIDLKELMRLAPAIRKVVKPAALE